jgi:hypothetical protein
MPITKKRTELKIGTKFTKKYKEKTYQLKVVHHHGRLAYQLKKEVFSSPSAAAKSLTKTEVNGWVFWNMD